MNGVVYSSSPPPPLSLPPSRVGLVDTTRWKAWSSNGCLKTVFLSWPPPRTRWPSSRRAFPCTAPVSKSWRASLRREKHLNDTVSTVGYRILVLPRKFLSYSRKYVFWEKRLGQFDPVFFFFFFSHIDVKKVLVPNVDRS